MLVTDPRLGALRDRFVALLDQATDLSPEYREQATHYWDYAEWELAADYLRDVQLTATQRAGLASLVEEANKRFEEMQGPWWKRIFRK